MRDRWPTDTPRGRALVARACGCHAARPAHVRLRPKRRPFRGLRGRRSAAHAACSGRWQQRRCCPVTARGRHRPLQQRRYACPGGFGPLHPDKYAVRTASDRYYRLGGAAAAACGAAGLLAVVWQWDTPSPGSGLRIEVQLAAAPRLSDGLQGLAAGVDAQPGWVWLVV